jgi:hypothetical protein
MKKTIIKLICAFGILLSSSFGFAKDGKKMYVSTDSVVLKQKPNAFSQDVSVLNYGDEVFVTEENKKWSLIYSAKDEKLQGWVPLSSLTKKRIAIGATRVSADADEIALAGKGFNSTIEAVYAEEFSIDYSPVDFIESNEAKTRELEKFIKDGQLKGGSDE